MNRPRTALVTLIALLLAAPVVFASVGPAPAMHPTGDPSIAVGGMSLGALNVTYADANRLNVTDKLIVRSPNNNTIMDVYNSTVRLFPPTQDTRVKQEWWSAPAEVTPKCRPLSIEAHGANDTYDPTHNHVTFYTANSNCADYTQKALQWEWGNSFDDQLHVMMNLHPQKEIYTNNAVKIVRNTTATTPSSYPGGLVLSNNDPTAGNGFALMFAANDDAGAGLREFAGLRGHYIDRTSTSIDGELSFWTTINNVRTDVGHASATGWQFSKRVTASQGLTVRNSLVNSAITEAATSRVVTMASSETDTGYGVTCTPNWATLLHVTAKTATTFTVNFGTAAPASATVDCMVFR